MSELSPGRSMLSAFTFSKPAPRHEPAERRVAQKADATEETRRTAATRAAIAGIAGIALDLKMTSAHNKAIGDIPNLADKDKADLKLTAAERAVRALRTGASLAGAAGTFANTEGASMPSRLLRSGAAYVAPGAALYALNAAGFDVMGVKKEKTGNRFQRRQERDNENEFARSTGRAPDTLSFGRKVRYSRPYL